MSDSPDKPQYELKPLFCINCKAKCNHAFGPTLGKWICTFCGETREDDQKYAK